MNNNNIQAGGDAPLVQVRDLCTTYPVRVGARPSAIRRIRAVDGVTFDIPRRTTLGLVGESGCGKTTLARTILRLVPATSGSVLLDGLDVLRLKRRELRGLRRRMQIVFQDPVGSLNPRMTVGEIVGEGLRIHQLARGRALRDDVADLLEQVGLGASAADRYPHEFSGGQRQRIGIARALALRPEFVVCDEPVSALDVSVQSQILNLLGDLQDARGLTYLLIAHNLAVVRQVSHRVAVMYLGRLVEIACAAALYGAARHPYTQALLLAVPAPDPDVPRRRFVLPGEIPSLLDPPAGCAFHPRCPLATDVCRRATPVLETKTGLQPEHQVACHLASEPLRLAEVDALRTARLILGSQSS